MPRFIEGQDRQQVTLVPDCLDDFIVDNNPVRVIDAFVDGPIRDFVCGAYHEE